MVFKRKSKIELQARQNISALRIQSVGHMFNTYGLVDYCQEWFKLCGRGESLGVTIYTEKGSKIVGGIYISSSAAFVSPLLNKRPFPTLSTTVYLVLFFARLFLQIFQSRLSILYLVFFYFVSRYMGASRLFSSSIYYRSS